MDRLREFCLIDKKRFNVVSLCLAPPSEIIAVCSLLLIDEDEVYIKNNWVTALLGLLILLAIWYIFRIFLLKFPRGRFDKRLKYFERAGLLDYALSDIERGIKKFDESVLIGQYCIMGKGTGLIVFYDEISSITLKKDGFFNHKGSGNETWYLMIEAGDKPYKICSVKINEQTQTEWAEICNFLRLKAPNITIK